jgi:hypothetical protein
MEPHGDRHSPLRARCARVSLTTFTDNIPAWRTQAVRVVCFEPTNERGCAMQTVARWGEPVRMLQVDPKSKAAECDRAIEFIADPERRIVLESLRSFWIALCDERSLLDQEDRVGPLSAINQIHAELMAVCRRAMH